MSVSWNKARKKALGVRFREPIVNYHGVVPFDVFDRAMKKRYHNWESFSGTYHGDLDCEVIQTSEGVMYAVPDLDYVVEGIKGELYSIKKDIFDMTYDVTNDE